MYVNQFKIGPPSPPHTLFFENPRFIYVPIFFKGVIHVRRDIIIYVSDVRLSLQKQGAPTP